MENIASLALAALLAFGSFIGVSEQPAQLFADASSEQAQVVSDWQWNEAVAPDYYLIAGPANRDVIAELENAIDRGSIGYGGVDGLGRPTFAFASLTHCSVVSAKNRGRQPIDLDPVGFTDNAITEISLPGGKTYRGYFWNRSHLIADSLGGDPIKENLITGTRTQNVGSNDADGGGMGYCENIARDWLWANKSGTLEYAVVPVYVGDELIPRVCTVDMKSSDGEIDLHVLVFNTAKGHEIDYKTGTWK